MDDYIDRLITNIKSDVDTGWDFFKAVDFETGAGAASEIRHIELDNGLDAITSRYADGFSYKEDGPYTWWNLETVRKFAQEFRMKVVVLKKHDGDQWDIPEWNMTDNFDEYDCSKGLNVINYCKDIEDAYVFDTIDDVEKAYNEYTDNLKDEFAEDNSTLLEDLDKAQKGRLLEELDKAQKEKDKIIEQVKRKSPSEFVMMPCSADFDADFLEIMPKFSTMFYDGYNGVSYALGLILNKE